MLKLLKTDNLSAFSGIAHGFTTRNGGVSVGGLASLNLALRCHETRSAVSENFARVASALGHAFAVDDVVLLSQVHGARVVMVTEGTGPLRTAGDYDGAVTCTQGVLLVVRTADCVPVLLAGPGVVGVAHAGWRGVAGAVLASTVASMCRAGGIEPAAISASIGPHISVDAYEVGEEVVSGIRGTDLEEGAFVRRDLGPKPHVNLGRACAVQLRALGVHDVALTGGCTLGEDRFFSHRGQGAGTGRLAGVIGLVRQ